MTNIDFNDDPPEQTGDGFTAEQPGFDVDTTQTAESLLAAGSGETTSEPLDTRDAEQRAYDELKAVCDAAEAKLEDARVQSKTGLQREREALQEIQDARAALQKRFPPLTPDQAIKQHLASEQAKRVAAAERAKEYGRAPGPSSQVDAASGRGSRRGWGRSFGERGVVGPDGNLIKLPDGSVAVARQKPQYRRPLYVAPTGQKA